MSDSLLGFVLIILVAASGFALSFAIYMYLSSDDKIYTLPLETIEPSKDEVSL